MVALLALAAAAYMGSVVVRVMRQSARDETRAADAIVVFGAAEYNGRPSPVFRARLDHALDLFHRGVAPFVIVTGGSGGEANYSEGGVGRTYLMEHGVPENNIIAETQGDSTGESAERVAVIMHTNGMNTCDAVSDAYHMFRLKQMLAREGIVAYAAPRPEMAKTSRWHMAVVTAREAASYALWKLHIT
jgi:uncharacterized SAM-binding protein YcdF (DUF218 family)